MRDKVLHYIRERELLRAGDRVAVAVSGGADSVALLRLLLELRGELGIFLAIAHFNHGLRGEQSQADEAFVADLARRCELDFLAEHADVGAYASARKLSVEAAGRELRYRWFVSLARQHRIDCIATAHTLDDQAETVLLKLLRGAGTRGLAGIYPVVRLASDAEKIISTAASPNTQVPSVRVVRPLLCVARADIETYLAAVGQSWREDESNLDRRFLRNRVRHELLPLLGREYNPNVRQVLSDLAEISRAEEESWSKQVDRELAARTAGAEPNARASNLNLNGFSQLPLPLQRRVLQRFAERQQVTLDFEHVEKLRLCALGQIARTELPAGCMAQVIAGSLEIQADPRAPSTPYHYALRMPGEIHIAELGLCLRAQVVAENFAREAAPGVLLSLNLIGSELLIRNWEPGDRFRPAHSRSKEKLKRLFNEEKIPAAERPMWPVAVRDGEIVWVRGFPVAQSHCWTGAGDAIRIDVVPL